MIIWSLMPSLSLAPNYSNFFFFESPFEGFHCRNELFWERGGSCPCLLVLIGLCVQTREDKPQQGSVWFTCCMCTPQGALTCVLCLVCQAGLLVWSLEAHLLIRTGIKAVVLLQQGRLVLWRHFKKDKQLDTGCSHCQHSSAPAAGLCIRNEA